MSHAFFVRRQFFLQIVRGGGGVGRVFEMHPLFLLHRKKGTKINQQVIRRIRSQNHDARHQIDKEKQTNKIFLF
jgi:hypothetical protein